MPNHVLNTFAELAVLLHVPKVPGCNQFHAKLKTALKASDPEAYDGPDKSLCLAKLNIFSVVCLLGCLCSEVILT